MEIKNSDGVQSSFYYFLWCKSKFSRNMRIRIPSTIMYEDGIPTTWFFTGKSGKILKKNHGNTNQKKITAFFKKLEKENKTNIAAVYMYNSNEGFRSHQLPSGQEINYMKDVLESKGYVIHYFTFPALYAFMAGSNRYPSGILQEFIVPLTLRNEEIRAYWSEGVTLLEKCVNRKYMLDDKYDIYEKAVTFEGAEYLVEHSSRFSCRESEQSSDWQDDQGTDGPHSQPYQGSFH